MRLLRLREDGEFSLVEHTTQIPPYAILSHTWDAAQGDVTFQDIVAGTAETKSGYGKLKFCREQAAKDNLQWFWVDTCCIDKRSSTERSETINSVFDWYHEAVKCYVYLSDVSIDTPVANDQSLQQILTT